MSKPNLTQKELKELLSYDPETGLFVRKLTRRTDYIGKIAGGVNGQGYISIKVKGICYLAHRLAWLYMTGSWPENEVDHINQILSDNRWINLRDVTSLENQKNHPLRSTNASGFTGVHWHKQCKKWRVEIMVNRKSIHLGLYKNKDDAIQVRKEANIKYGFHPNHGMSKEAL